MLEEYFSSGDVAEVARSLSEQVRFCHAQAHFADCLCSGVENVLITTRCQSSSCRLHRPICFVIFDESMRLAG